MENIKANLKELVELPGAPGFEAPVRKYIENKLNQYGIDSYFVDKLGSLLVEVKGTDPNAPAVHFDAHMDEPCFMVKYIDEKGFIYIVPLGVIAENIAIGQRVQIHTKKGDLIGAFGAKSFHLSTEEERRGGIKIEDMTIDIGANSKEQAYELGIKPGLPITFDVEMKELPNNCVMAKAMDNRSGCVVLLEVVRRLKDNPVKSTVYASFSVQEELILRGSETVFSGLKAFFGAAPEISISYDICLDGGYPGLPKYKAPIEINKGPGIKLYDRSRASHYFQVVPEILIDTLVKAALNNNIPYQYEFLSGSTNTDVFAVENTGVIAGAISIPCRYTHSPIEIVSITDIDNAIKLSMEFINECPNVF